MTPTIKIGMAQLLVEGGEPERNLKRAGVLIDEAKDKKCDIVLLPECLDLAWTHPSAKTEVCPIPGEHSNYFCKQAKEKDIFLCVGLTERAQDKVYNSAILIDNNGDIILKYRKINLLVVEQEYYSVGNILSVVDTKFGKIGVNICADNYMDGLSIGHTLARMGAQIIISPSSWTVDFSVTQADDPYGDKWLKPYSILAKAYDIAIVGTTSVGVIVGGPYEGKKMIGCSLAVNKNGVIAQGTFNEFAGELVIAEFNVPSVGKIGTEIGIK
jgi:predicted amidohydrolase